MNDSYIMKQLLDPDWWKEKRIREYKEDGTLEAFRKMMFEVHCYAIPIIIINTDCPDASIFDIDIKSKEQIEKIKVRMKEYIRNNYSDILDADKIL